MKDWARSGVSHDPLKPCKHPPSCLGRNQFCDGRNRGNMRLFARPSMSLMRAALFRRSMSNGAAQEQIPGPKPMVRIKDAHWHWNFVSAISGRSILLVFYNFHFVVAWHFFNIQAVPNIVLHAHAQTFHFLSMLPRMWFEVKFIRLKRKKFNSIFCLGTGHPSSIS